MSEWTNINDGKPPVGMPLIVTIDCTFRNQRELRYPVVYRKSFYSDSYGFYEHGLEDQLLTAEYSPVIAWMPLPEPYKEEVKE